MHISCPQIWLAPFFCQFFLFLLFIRVQKTIKNCAPWGPLMMNNLEGSRKFTVYVLYPLRHSWAISGQGVRAPVPPAFKPLSVRISRTCRPANCDACGRRFGNSSEKVRNAALHFLKERTPVQNSWCMQDGYYHNGGRARSATSLCTVQGGAAARVPARLCQGGRRRFGCRSAHARTSDTH